MKQEVHPVSRKEEWFNSISHGITALSAIGGLVVLIVFGALSDQDWSLFSALFYGSSLLALYTFSSLYHGIPHPKTKSVFKILDHCGIFLLIAGTYTPIMLMVLQGAIGWVFFGLQWGMALIGITLKIFYTGKYKFISTAMYAIMGWLIVFQIERLGELLPEPAFWLLVSGGLAYTFGIIFYIFDKRIPYAHFIWHLFVMAGSLLHYLMMVMYVFTF